MPSRATVAHAMDDWWGDVEHDVLRCFDGRGAIPPGEIAVALGVSEASATSLLAIMAREGKVKICLVSPPDGAEVPRARRPHRRSNRPSA